MFKVQNPLHSIAIVQTALEMQIHTQYEKLA